MAFYRLTTRDGLTSDFIRAVLEARDGSIWIATTHGGLNRLKSGKITALTTENGLSSNDIQSIDLMKMEATSPLTDFSFDYSTCCSVRFKSQRTSSCRSRAKGRSVQTKRLGNSDMNLTPIGIGAWAIGGGGWQFAWGPQDDHESIAAIRKALDAGLNWIDTAAVYGLGHSEEVVAKALEGRQQRPYIFTKCERTWDERGQITGSLKADSIRGECEASLRRLRVDVIDLYQIHWPEPDEDIEEGWSTLAKLKEEGKVRWIGVSNFNVEQMKRAAGIAPITSLQPPYSIVSPGIEQEILPYAQANNIGVIVYSPMKSGLLTGKMTRERIANMPEDDFRKRTPNFQEPLLTRNLKLVELLREIGSAHGRTPGEVAIAWTLRHPAVTAAIVGIRSPQQVDGVIGAADFRLSDEEIRQIDEFITVPA